MYLSMFALDIFLLKFNLEFENAMPFKFIEILVVSNASKSPTLLNTIYIHKNVTHVQNLLCKIPSGL